MTSLAKRLMVGGTVVWTVLMEIWLSHLTLMNQPPSLCLPRQFYLVGLGAIIWLSAEICYGIWFENKLIIAPRLWKRLLVILYGILAVWILSQVSLWQLMPFIYYDEITALLKIGVGVFGGIFTLQVIASGKSSGATSAIPPPTAGGKW